ncbi:MAG TPA: hypothetical protein DCG19_14340 [Cryomorphaceae bacterium]|nr:hypothetical protein [Owenweeksia sp.]MBF98106.1 hypothetical protein [Owenweeksia sp.]HAD98586.1 hypothetical protein [Cryomorphaceae bacterium]HBF18739.1 hypothetical protein [Cryomorphaceae bacterium]|tara:strand:+ start:3687 stop:5726 length:2040 start_codon:yes stop_codon:yes gene_type:complete
MKMLYSLAFGLMFSFLCCNGVAQTRPGSLRGTVMDFATGEPLTFARVSVKDEAGVVISTGVTDMDGKYNLNPIAPGEYTVEVSLIGYQTVKLRRVIISPHVPTVQDFKMSLASTALSEVVIVEDRPLIEKTKSSKITTAEDIQNMAVRDITFAASKAAGVSRTSGNSTVFFQNPQGVWNSSILGDITISGAAHPNPLTDFNIGFMSPDKVEILDEPKELNKMPEARILTAGEIHDFSKWELWKDISDDQLKQWKEYWNIAPLERYSLQLTFTNGIPIVDAEVVFKDRRGKVIWTCRTDNTGKAEMWSKLFDQDQEGQRAEIHYNDRIFTVDGLKPITQGMNIMQIDEPCNLPEVLDISFVVDATGSMSDEIAFLKAELGDVIGRIQSVLNHSSIRTSSVFYRDKGDEYVTRESDFSDNVSQTENFIQEQNAGGGGDYPEALIEAMEVAVNKFKWSNKAVSRIMFLVLDAPPHYGEDELRRLHQLLKDAARKGIRIIPIASSGIDKRTEYLLRSMALATNGTYTFLTDDSGVGDSHIEPTTDSYEVELLNDLMVRLIHQFAFIPACMNQAMEAKVSVDPPDQALENPLHPNDPDHTEGAGPEDVFFKLYPNPTRDLVNIELDKEVEELFLTDLRGKILQRKEIGKERSFQLSLGNYPVGTYFIRFQAEKKWITRQIIRKA